MSSGLPRSVAIVGLGLMGASLARALKSADPAIRVVGVEPAEAIRARAVADGVADEVSAAPGPALGGCEFAVLCTPVAAIEALLEPVAALLPEGAILTDVAGAKERLAALAAGRVRAGVRYVGTHPMFGGHGGYDAARADRWAGGTVAVTTDGDPAAVDRVAALHARLGAKVIRCTAAEHDAAVAMVSHLPYLVASALALAAEEAGPLAKALAGPGLRDTTRVAEFPFDIQGEVSRRNARLPEAAARLQRHLAAVLGAIAESPEAARVALERARAARKDLF